MSPRAERAAQRHTRNAAVMVQAHWRGNRARVAYRAQRGAQAAAEAPAPSPPLADAAAEEEPAVLSVSMTKSAAGFGLGFIMEDIVLVNRVDPGGQAQVRPRLTARQASLAVYTTQTGIWMLMR